MSLMRGQLKSLCLLPSIPQRLWLQRTEAELRGTVTWSFNKYFRALLTESWWKTEAALFFQNIKLSINLEFTSCSNTFPLEALNVDVAKLSQPVTQSAPQTGVSCKSNSESLRSPEITQPHAADPKAHDPLPTATLGTGSVAIGINPENCESLKHLGTPQKFHVINPEKNNQPKHWTPTNSLEHLLICIPSLPTEALPVASLPLPAPLECFLASGSS